MKIPVVAALLLIASCSPGGGDESGASLIRVHPESTGVGLDAIVSGVVEVDVELGCVWLSDEQGSRYPVVWPVGTTETSDPFQITLPDGVVVSHGDRVSGGGGYIPAGPGTGGWEPFPDECVQTGDAAVFNSNSPIDVEADVGVAVSETLFGRFSIPQAIGLELISVNPNARSVAVTEFVEGTIHLYQSSQYESPSDAISGASGGGGFIHLWADGEIYSYPGRISDEPLIFDPEPLRVVEGIASTLEVVPAGAERAWLVQDGVGFGPTLIELVDLVEVQLARLGSFEIAGSWQPVGSTVEGLVLNSNEGEPRVALIGFDGSVVAEVDGVALSVGWNSVAVLNEDGSLSVMSGRLDAPVEITPPGPGVWASVGGPLIPSEAPPVVTGFDELLVALVSDAEKGALSAGDLVVVDPAGSARVVYPLREGPRVASWSRAGDWIVVVEGSEVSLVPAAGGAPIDLGSIIPPDHWVLTAG